MRDLLALELDLRLEQGDQPDRHAYRRGFPDHDDVIDAVFGSRERPMTPHQSAFETENPTVDGPVNATDDRAPAKDTDALCSPAEIMPGAESRHARSGRSNTGTLRDSGELGRGGMGIVYQARQVALNRLVALKVIKSAEFASEAELIRFQNEAEAVAQLDHPHIVPIYEVGDQAGQRFFSMKLIAGQQPGQAAG